MGKLKFMELPFFLQDHTVITHLTQVCQIPDTHISTQIWQAKMNHEWMHNWTGINIVLENIWKRFLSSSLHRYAIAYTADTIDPQVSKMKLLSEMQSENKELEWTE